MLRAAMMTLGMALTMFFAPSMAASEIRIEADGWYSWEVAAGNNGQKSCCYDWNNGKARRKGCTLGNGMNHFSVSDPCETASGTMNIYVEVKGGKVKDIWPISSDCPVSADSEIQVIEDVTSLQSVAWLEEQVQHNRGIADEAIMTISFHTQDEALGSLFGILEDRQQRQKNREQALFWLIQSDYDEAFVYLDKLLD